MIIPSKDKMYNGRKEIGFENLIYFCKAKDLRPTLYDGRVINLGYTLIFLTHSDEALEIEKFKRARQNKIEFSYDYENLNASYVNEKNNLFDDYFQEIINLDFEKIDSLFQQTSSLKPYVSTMILKKIIIDLKDEMVVTSLRFKLKKPSSAVSYLFYPRMEPSVFARHAHSLMQAFASKREADTLASGQEEGWKQLSVREADIYQENRVLTKLPDVETGVESSEKVVSETENKSENDCQVIEKVCDSEENPNVIALGMFKLSVSSISVTKTSCASNSVETKLKIKRHKRTSSKQHGKQVDKDVLRANKAFVPFSDLDTLSSVRIPKPSGVMWMRKGLSNTVIADFEFDCNNARNAVCNARMNAYVDVNDLFVFDDVGIIKSHVSKMPFRKKPSASLNVPSRRCSKHMTGNRALVTNFMKKFLGTVRFGNNDFAIIAGYGDVVIGSMTIKNVYCVEDGVDFLTGDRSSNLYTIALNEVASNALACLLAKDSSSRSWLWHQHLSHLNFASINNLVKNNLVQGLSKMKFKKDHLCSACEQGKIHWKHHKSETAFALNKPLYLLHMDLCDPMCVESINGKRYMLVVVDDYLRYTWRVRTDNGTEFKNKTLAKFFDEVGISHQFSTARTPQQNGVVERRNRSLVKAARTMLTFANLPLFLWAEAITMACFTQNYSIIHKRFDKTPYELMNKRKPIIKFFHVFECICYLLNDYDDVGKLKAKRDIEVFIGFSKESAAFRIYNKRTRKIHETINVNFDEISEMASKQFSLEPGLSNLNETWKSSNPAIMKSSTTNVETSNVKIPSYEDEVFHESFESFQEEFSSSSLNDDIQQRSEEVRIPSSNTQSVSNNMVPNVDEASTSHNVFNERLEDAYFDASIGYDEMFAPVSQIEDIRLFLAYGAHKDFTIFQMDVKTTFLNGILKEEVYVGKPLGFASKQYPDHVYALDKALYGLKQAPRAWPDIMFATCMCARYQKNPNKHHVSAVKRIFHYLKGTINIGLWYSKDSGFDLTAYSDADLAGCHLDRKSTSGSVQFLGDKLVYWSSKKHDCVSISIAKSEYVAVSGCCA
nr:hypothetical protein [Tanacetum cinerariifolium]